MCISVATNANGFPRTDTSFEVVMVFTTKAGTGLGQFDLNITTGGVAVERDNATVDPIKTGDYSAKWTLFAPPSWSPGNYTVGVGTSLPSPLLFLILFLCYPPSPPSLISCHMLDLHPPPSFPPLCLSMQPCAMESVGAMCHIVRCTPQERPTSTSPAQAELLMLSSAIVDNLCVINLPHS